MTTKQTPEQAPAEKPAQEWPNPTAGGSYIRNPKTGELTRVDEAAKAVEQE